jgi:hypothetical protein
MGIKCRFLDRLLPNLVTISSELFGFRLNHRLHSFTDLSVVVASLNMQLNLLAEIYRHVFSRQDDEIS